MSKPVSISQHLSDLQGQTVLVVGDVMLDEYVIGDVQRISPEAPIPILSHQASFTTTGGAANVARNLAQLGSQVTLIGCLGEDLAATTLSDALELIPNLIFCPIKCADRRTTMKTRYMSSGQQILRVDRETTAYISAEQGKHIEQQAKSLMEKAMVLVLSDYAKGCLSAALMAKLIALAKANNIAVVADPKSADFSDYAGATLLTPNLSELSKACRRRLSDLDEIEDAARKQLQLHNIEKILVTLSGRGMMLVDSKKALHAPAYPCDVFDVSGAGDTALALMTSARMTNHSDEDGMYIANLGASIVVAKTGTSSLSPGELLAASDIETVNTDADRVKKLIREWKTDNKTIGFTNGCFDLLHPGHLHVLRHAALKCDHLIVGLNSDNSVGRVKGPNRPIQPQQDRARALSALSFVSAVAVFDEETPESLITLLSPDVLFKGGDYKAEDLVGYEHVTTNGGRVEIIPTLPDYSTSSFLNTNPMNAR